MPLVEENLPIVRQRSVRRTLSYLGIALIGVSILIGISILQNQKTALEKQVSLLTTDKDYFESKFSTSESKAQLYSSIGQYLAQQFDELDKLLVGNDTISVDYINWLRTHAVFREEDIAQANFLDGKFISEHTDILSRYSALEADIREKLNLMQEFLPGGTSEGQETCAL